MTNKQFSQLEQLIDIASEEDLTTLLNKSLTFALITENDSLANWLQCELGGYTEKIPGYRKVSGFFTDRNNRKLHEYYSNLSDINYLCFNNGISELEKWSKENKQLTIQSAKAIDIISNRLSIPITQFSFQPPAIIPVLQKIRIHLIEELIGIRKSYNTNTTYFTKNEIQKLILNLHPTIQNVASKLIEDEHYSSAILKVFIKLVNEVQTKSNVYDRDNSPLMDFVFSPQKPILKISDDVNERQGLLFLFKGAVMYFRNSNAHHIKETTDSSKAFQVLEFASFLLKTLDECVLVTYQ